MARNLNRMVDTMTYDGLISGLTPEAKVKGVTIRKLGAAATLVRGTILAKSSGSAGDDKYVILGTTAAPAVQEAAATYKDSPDTAVVAGKTYYTRSGESPNYVYTPVADPVDTNIATYYEIDTPAVAAQDAEVLTADCILADDIYVGTSDDVNAAVYDMGCFDPAKLTVKSGYTITEADKDVLRERGIYLVAKSAI